MSDIQDDIENKAEEVKDSSPNQHLGDAMDDADQATGKTTGDGELEAAGQSEQTEADGPEQDDSGNALDDVDLEPPSS